VGGLLPKKRHLHTTTKRFFREAKNGPEAEKVGEVADLGKKVFVKVHAVDLNSNDLKRGFDVSLQARGGVEKPSLGIRVKRWQSQTPELSQIEWILRMQG